MSKSIVKVQNCYSWLYTDNIQVKDKIWKALRFRDRGYFHSRLFKQKLWDGYRDFFGRRSGRFLTGLLPEVKKALEVLKLDYTIQDERNLVNFKYDEIDDKFLNQWLHHNSKEFQEKWQGLRDYQVDLTNQIIKYKRGIIFAPTSAGKTAIMVAILKALPQTTPTLILANKKSLCDQNYDALVDWGFENVGRLYDKYKDPNVFTCATFQSLHKIEKLLPHIKCIVVDEIHENMSKVPKKFYNKLPNCSIRVAVSATPFKFGGKDKCQKYSVKGYFGPPMKTKSDAAVDGILVTSKLQERGILSGADATFYPVHEPEIPHDIYFDAVTNGIAENLHFHNIVTKLAKTMKGRTLILVERLKHGDILNKLIPGSVWVQGRDDLDTRKEIIHQLQVNEDIIAIVTQGIFNVGINVFIHNLINACGGQAEHVIIQRFGRGLRTASDKEILKYYDFVFNINDYLYDHSMRRIKIIKKEGHNVIIKDKVDF